MFDKNWFLKNKNTLLWLLNTEAGRHLLSVEGEEPVIDIFSNGWKQYLGTSDKKDYFKYDFRCYDAVAKYLLPYLTYEEILRTDYPRQQPIGLTEKYKCFLD